MIVGLRIYSTIWMHRLSMEEHQTPSDKDDTR
jgi:hypothetical protein